MYRGLCSYHKDFHDHRICYSSLNFAEYHWIQVTRNGRLVEVPIYDVVVGDIIPLKSGDQEKIQSFFHCWVVSLNWSFIIKLKYDTICCRCLQMVS